MCQEAEKALVARPCVLVQVGGLSRKGGQSWWKVLKLCPQIKVENMSLGLAKILFTFHNYLSVCHPGCNRFLTFCTHVWPWKAPVGGLLTPWSWLVAMYFRSTDSSWNGQSWGKKTWNWGVSFAPPRAAQYILLCEHAPCHLQHGKLSKSFQGFKERFQFTFLSMIKSLLGRWVLDYSRHPLWEVLGKLRKSTH